MEKLQKEGVLLTPAIVQAFLANDRWAYVPSEFALEAYVDAPLPIGGGQTISQPYTVAFMMELLAPRAGQKILDVGFGSGWTTGILAQIVGTAGKVYGLEIQPHVYDLGKANLGKFAYPNIELYNQSGWEGLPEAAPFDRILVSAAASKVPEALKEQLRDRGTMVIPVGPGAFCTIKVLQKSGQKFAEQDYPGFAFVPLVKT